MDFFKGRREFLVFGSKLIGLYSVTKLSSCGPAQSDLSNFYTEDSVTVKDMYTHDIQSRGFKGDTLKASDFAQGKPVVLYIREGSHKHPFTITKPLLKKLASGQKVQLESAKVSGHTHTIIIDPGYNPPRANQATVKLSSFDDNPAPNDNRVENTFKIAVDTEEQPMLYMTSDTELDPQSAEYCVGNSIECSLDSNWLKMQIEERATKRRLYKLAERIKIDKQTTVHIRAKKSGNIIQRIFGLMGKSE